MKPLSVVTIFLFCCPSIPLASAFAPIAVGRASPSAASPLGRSKAQSSISILDATGSFSRPMLATTPATTSTTTQLMVVDAASAVDFVGATAATASSSIQIAETQAWVQPAATFLSIFLNFMSLAMLSRVVLSWYPSASLKDAPWIFLVIPTEPLLRAVKGVIPPAFGVDITPVFWLAIFTFFNEILLGQQGLLTMKIKYGI